MWKILAIITALAFGLAVPDSAQSASSPSTPDEQFAALPWISSPQKPKVTERATIALIPDTQFLDAQGSAKFLTLTGNLPDGENYILVAKKYGWWADYSFSDIGYVKDDEKIDADALLKELKDADASQNEARAEQGLEPLTTVGWAVPPHYDATSHNLEYGIILSSPSGQNINYRMRMLGRRGVMDATLVTSQQTLQADLAAFRAANRGFAFIPDESYASYKEGDKVSEYGLAALVTGGAAAAAIKGGLFKGLLLLLAKFWKLIALAFVGGFAAIRRIFAGNRDNDLLATPVGQTPDETGYPDER